MGALARYLRPATPRKALAEIAIADASAHWNTNCPDDIAHVVDVETKVAAELLRLRQVLRILKVSNDSNNLDYSCKENLILIQTAACGVVGERDFCYFLLDQSATLPPEPMWRDVLRAAQIVLLDVSVLRCARGEEKSARSIE